MCSSKIFSPTRTYFISLINSLVLIFKFLIYVGLYIFYTHVLTWREKKKKKIESRYL